MATKKIEIVNGPSKFDISVSLFDGKENERRIVDFSLGWQGYVLANLHAVIGGVARVHQHDGEWTITGSGKIQSKHEDDWERLVGNGKILNTAISFTANYSTSVRRGSLVINK